MSIQIHQDFKLNGKSFSDAAHLLEFVARILPEHLAFLEELFNETKFITALTSGSTGQPKKINIKKSKMINSAIATGIFFDLKPKTTALHCLSSMYIAGKMMWVRALHLGWYLDVVTPDATPLLHLKSRYDFTAMVPLQVQNSLKELKKVKKLIIGGAAISHELTQDLLRLPIQSYQTYGMTETITHIAVRELIKPIKDQFYKTLAGIELTTDKRGCLVIKAPKLSDTSIVTNDIVYLHNKNEFKWLGRYDNVVNSGGVKLFPEQIEQKLKPFIVPEFIVAGLSDEKLGERLVLIIASDTPIKTIQTSILKAGLTKYERPKSVLYLNSFPRLANAKLDRLKILHKFKAY